LVVAAADGIAVGFLVNAFLFGFRHGFDWDHIAAITDITSSQGDARRSFVLACLYALGHGAVVFVLGVIAIALGDFIPESVDEVMGRIVGITLIVLAVYVFYSLLRHGRDFRMRSRWMLILSGIRHLIWRLRGSPQRPVVIEHEHEHVAGHGHDHEHADPAGSHSVAALTHSHRHRHVATVPLDPLASYTSAGAIGIGMIHGVGAETPTQVLVFIAAAGAGGTATGIAVLVAFLVGLFSSNTLVALASASGFLRRSKSFTAYATIAVATGLLSLVLGLLLVLGRDDVLPGLFE
jgi:cytochrome c biogenesis protein CcdA